MIVKIKDVQIGDEIVVSMNSRVMFGKAIRRTKKGTLVVSTKVEVIERSYTGYGRTRRWKERSYICAPVEEHNGTKYLRNYGDVWVVRRDGILMDV